MSTFSKSERQNKGKNPHVFALLTWKCASRHNGVHFFDIWTSESGTFWLGNVLRATAACTFSTCELPKVVRTWRVLYILTCTCASRHNGIQKWSETVNFSHFWLGNVLCACTFSTSQLPRVVRTWSYFGVFTYKCASRHNGVHFFNISTSKSGLRPCFFFPFDLEMCFAPQRRAIFHLSSGQLAPHPPL